MISNIENAKVLALLGDMITTDHISPAGSFKDTTPAGKYLVERQVPVREFNSYGSRRGNHEVMMRGTFANIRIKNEMLDGVEGGYTKGPDGEQTSIYDAAMAYQEAGTPLVIFGGEQYGAGSSRDWAAKGTALLGVKAVIAESFERIHRSNLVGMGVIPFEFTGGDTRKSLGLTGDETVSISGLAGHEAAARGALHHHLWRTGQRRRSRSNAGSIPRSRSNTSNMAACCTTCCAIWQVRLIAASRQRRDRPLLVRCVARHAAAPTCPPHSAVGYNRGFQRNPMHVSSRRLRPRRALARGSWPISRQAAAAGASPAMARQLGDRHAEFASRRDAVESHCCVIGSRVARQDRALPVSITCWVSGIGPGGRQRTTVPVAVDHKVSGTP